MEVSTSCHKLPEWLFHNPYFTKLIDRCVNHKLSCVRTDDISGTNFRPGQTNIKGSDGLPLRRAFLEQRANPH